jgi:hypothetical protein
MLFYKCLKEKAFLQELRKNKEDKNMKSITRTISTTTITAKKVSVVNGEVVTQEVDTVIVTGEKVDNEKALKLVRKEYGRDAQYIVTSVKEEENVYSIDLDTFVANAKIIK